MASIGYATLLMLSLLFPRQECTVISKQEFIIEGDTSLGDFKCKYESMAKDTLFWNGKTAKNTLLQYEIPGKEFGCGNFILNKDFRKTIRVKEYQYTKIELLNIRKNADEMACDVKLQLAGKQKRYQNVELKRTKNTLKGTLVVNFSDFDLQSPKKMGGLVKVNEKINLCVVLYTE